MQVAIKKTVTDKEILEILESRKNDKSMSFEEAYKKWLDYIDNMSLYV